LDHGDQVAVDYITLTLNTRAKLIDLLGNLDRELVIPVVLRTIEHVDLFPCLGIEANNVLPSNTPVL